jgi:hypothetical protein
LNVANIAICRPTHISLYFVQLREIFEPIDTARSQAETEDCAK